MSNGMRTRIQDCGIVTLLIAGAFAVAGGLAGAPAGFSARWPGPVAIAALLAIELIACWLVVRMHSQHERRDRAIEAGPYALLLFNGRGRCVMASSRVARLIPSATEPFVGRTVEEIFREPGGGVLAIAVRSVLTLPSGGQGAIGLLPTAEIAIVSTRSGAAMWIREVEAKDQPESARKMAHDLMQPLGAIANYAELIRELSEGKVREYAEHVTRITAEVAARIRRPSDKPSGPETPQ